MIQRKQSLFLLLGAIDLVLVAFTPFVTSGNESYSLLSAPSSTSHIAGYLFLACAVISIATIFMYKNRSGQMRMCNILSADIVVALGIGIYGSMDGLKADGASPGLAIYLSVIALILILLAKAGIKKDDKLVKSVDRIR